MLWWLNYNYKDSCIITHRQHRQAVSTSFHTLTCTQTITWRDYTTERCISGNGKIIVKYLLSHDGQDWNQGDSIQPPVRLGQQLEYRSEVDDKATKQRKERHMQGHEKVTIRIGNIQLDDVCTHVDCFVDD